MQKRKRVQGQYGPACVPSFPWYHYCSKCHLSRVVPLETVDYASVPKNSESLYATVSLRRPISRRRRDAPSDSRLLPPPSPLFIRQTGRQTVADALPYILVYLSITWRARDELENYAKSEDALGESPRRSAAPPRNRR